MVTEQTKSFSRNRSHQIHCCDRWDELEGVTVDGGDSGVDEVELLQRGCKVFELQIENTFRSPKSNEHWFGERRLAWLGVMEP